MNIAHQPRPALHNELFLALPSQPRGLSDLEQAAETLAHAVHYLITEQLAGRRHAVEANRQAVAILCNAGQQLARFERRRPAQRSIAAWLRGAALHRATGQAIDPLGN